MKKRLSVLLAAVLLFTFCFGAAARENGVGTLKINPYGGEESAIDTVEWFSADGRYYLFLPADTDLNTAAVYFTASGGVTVDGAPVGSGGSAAAFTEGAHTLVCGGEQYDLRVMQSAAIPAVYIETQSGGLDWLHADKANKEPGSIRIYENGERTLDQALKQIKGRGNATWTAFPKKSYNIKFDKKTAVLGMAKAKKWTMVADYFDYSFLHNAYAWEFSEAFGLPVTCDYRHADLYVNHQYLGNYLICESVEIAENRVEINDLKKANEAANPGADLKDFPLRGSGANGEVLPGSVACSRKWSEIPNDPADISGGYLLEYEYTERYDEEPCGFVAENGQPVVIKSPEYASKAEVDYIAGLLDEANEALYSETGYNEEGKYYTDYFDRDSLVNTYILQELSMNFDAAFSSFFLYKPENGDKLIFSPVWDMDNAFGSPQANLGTSPGDTSIWWANQMGHYNSPTVLTAAYRHADFRAAVQARWAELRKAGVFEAVNEKIVSLWDTLSASAAMDMVRWDHAGTREPAAALAGWDSFVAQSVNHVADRTAVLDRGFGKNGAYLYYDVGEVFSVEWALVSPVSEVGDTVTVRDYTGNGEITPLSGKPFTGWNTAPDGSGKWYFPGDPLTLSAVNVLYAQWGTSPPDGASETPEKPTFWQSVLGFFQKIGDFFRRLFGGK